jgi:hypothetical protein
MLHALRPMNHSKLWDWVAGLIGLFSGGIAYSNFPMLGIGWQDIWSKAIQLAWTLFVAGLSAGVGVIVKKIIDEKWPKLKSIFKRKK